MGRRVILDTNILIDIERDRTNFPSLDESEAALVAVSIAELRVGVENAGSERRARERDQLIALVLDHFDTLDYTAETAVHHARLIAHAKKTGRLRSAHDLIIAAHAAETGRILISGDAHARFGDLPGVTAEPP